MASKLLRFNIFINDEQKSLKAIYTSPSHHLLRDRTHWILSPIVKEQTPLSPISTFQTAKGRLTRAALNLQWEILPQQEVLKTDSQTLFLDFDSLAFPLQLRHWKDGDVFYPLGMKGKKKSSASF